MAFTANLAARRKDYVSHHITYDGSGRKDALAELVARFGDAKESLIVVYNAEMPWLADALADAAKEQTTFAIDQLADLRAMNIETITHGPETGETLDGRWRGMSCKVQTSGSTVPLQIFSGIGRYHVLAGLCALAVGQALGANMVEALQALRAHTPLPGRMSLIPGIKKACWWMTVMIRTRLPGPGAGKSPPCPCQRVKAHCRHWRNARDRRTVRFHPLRHWRAISRASVRYDRRGRRTDN